MQSHIPHHANHKDDEGDHATGDESRHSNSETSSIATMEEEKAAGNDRRTPNPTESVDTLDMVNLPYRTLSANADMGEYLHETVTGLRSVQSHRSGRTEHYELI